ncbi:arylacetamide deacetylase-like 4 [Podarcis raffonei]|uniref:arylacetamide deacetylase-like 4 n=1 Tax=Podarcis raffonei TaxID=65483 RepID=UPI0023298BE7|nr:arylacetamide deacetylase-like 4 [Podarcis raffonei]
MAFGGSLWTLILYMTIFIHFLLFAWGAYYRLIGMQLPRGISCRGKLLLLDFSVGYGLTLAGILEKLGICHRFALFRAACMFIPVMRDPKLIIKDLDFDGVPGRVYWPKTSPAGKRRGIIFFHGGCGLFGSIRTTERICCAIAHQTDSVVMCPEFRLGPEYLSPTAVQDCCTAAIHFLKNSEEYGVDPSRIAFAGESSGGTYAAAICQELVTREDLPRVRAQVLIYPFLQGMDFNLPSHQQNHSVPPLFRKRAVILGLTYLTGKTMNVDGVLKGAHVPPDLREKYKKWISADYIPEEFKARGYVPVEPAPFSEELYEQVKRAGETMFAPLHAEDDIIRQLPETFILTCEYDILRDDGLLYKKRLEDHGVPVTWYHVQDGFHGIMAMAGLKAIEYPSTQKCLQSVIQFLKGL